MKFKLQLSEEKTMFGNLQIPFTAVQVKKIGGFKVRLLCKINGLEVFPCAVMPKGEYEGFIMLSKEKIKKWKLNSEEIYNVEIEKDESEYGMPLCEELQEVFNQDPIGKKRFDELSPGKQRNIIYYTSKIKSPALRAERAWLFINNLKNEVKGKERVPYILGLK